LDSRCCRITGSAQSTLLFFARGKNDVLWQR
jgi:hypothetical protein